MNTKDIFITSVAEQLTGRWLSSATICSFQMVLSIFLAGKWEGGSCFSLMEIVLIVKADIKRYMYENACSL